MTPRIGAIVPAAGHSRRMGRPKLLLKIQGRSVIEHAVTVLRSSEIEDIVVVVRPDDITLAEEVRRLQVTLVQPSPAPADMRASVEAGLDRLSAQTDRWDGWLLVPADHPTLSTEVVRELVSFWSQAPDRIAVPVWEGRRGHPTIFPWSTARDVRELLPGFGLNQVLRSRPEDVREWQASSSEVLCDLDTPEDWERVQQLHVDADRRNPPKLGDLD